ncbi:alpha/beta hydrolase domain-containing protein [Hyphomicrobium facile]|uniref:Alpha/beta hydrolase domain-containing protein n=1 Tax=Hyphomicrobium facile TaxID=51670 RepID=A0A1I7MUL7_9HYPH|nr:alpha/beta hydrolase domain-containing protein [Hyphomicrobium facile]SFV26094.1 hypothetical protein SAMN04488557_0323 [Hyphomicrobium facile]
MRLMAILGGVLLSALVCAAPAVAGKPKPGGNPSTDVPLPTLKGPIPVTSVSHPWNGAAWQNTPINLAKYGFVEEEYLASGKANVYNWLPNNNYNVNVTGSANYTTRVMIRRPKNMRHFSGRVVVEIINMSAGYDWTAMWGALWESIVANNDVYVGITSKPNVFDGMIRFDANRYSTLSMPNPLPAAQQTCGRLPGEGGYSSNLSKLYENGLAYDIFSQVAALVKSKDKTNPLAKPAKYAYLAGESQSGNYLITYYKYIHNLATVKGKPVFDGYIAEASISPLGAPINQCATALPANDPQLAVPGRGVPLVMINSQWDIWPARNNPRKPDSNTKTDKSRTWELAGSNHGWRFQYLFSDAAAADLVKIGFSEYNWSCPAETPEVPLYMAEKALYRHLIKWAEKGKAPPTAQPIELSPGTNTIVYDADGNAKGGLRLPMLTVPTTTYGVGRYVLSENCSEYKLWSADKLKALYPTHLDYTKKYGKATSDLVKKGYLLKEDGAALFKQAGSAKIPQ